MSMKEKLIPRRWNEWKDPDGFEITKSNGLRVRYKIIMSLFDERPLNPLIAVGLNPCGKTVDGNISRTTGKLCKIADNNSDRLGNEYDGLVIVNLCPIVTNSASGLKDYCGDIKDAVHSDNMEQIRKVAEQYKNSDVLLCFGRAIVRQHLVGYLRDIYNVLFNMDRKFLRIHVNRPDDKQPLNPPHPARLPSNVRLERFNVQRYINETFYGG